MSLNEPGRTRRHDPIASNLTASVPRSAANESPQYTRGTAPSPAAAAPSVGATARITGVTWSGTSSSPSVTIAGYGFGTTPPTSYHLPSTCGHHTGRDYGTALWFQDDTGNWRAGKGTGTVPSSCVGLIILSWTKNSIKLTFGSDYGTFGLANSGDNFVWTVKGYVWGGVIQYP